MKKYGLLLMAGFSLSIECATVRIQNNWNQGIGAQINDQTVKRGKMSNEDKMLMLGTLGLYGIPYWIEKQFGDSVPNLKDIKPTKSKFFNSGLKRITKVTFFQREKSGQQIRSVKYIVYPDIGAWKVEQRIFFNSPTDIRYGDKKLKIEIKYGDWTKDILDILQQEGRWKPS